MRRLLPTGPLLPLLNGFTRKRGGPRLGELLADRYGGKADSWETTVDRIQSGRVQRVTDVNADRLACFFGMPPTILWGLEWGVGWDDDLESDNDEFAA